MENNQEKINEIIKLYKYFNKCGPMKNYDIIHITCKNDYEFKISLDRDGTISEYSQSYYSGNEGGGDITFRSYCPSHTDYSLRLNDLYDRYINHLRETQMNNSIKKI